MEQREGKFEEILWDEVRLDFEPILCQERKDKNKTKTISTERGYKYINDSQHSSARTLRNISNAKKPGKEISFSPSFKVNKREAR